LAAVVTAAHDERDMGRHLGGAVVAASTTAMRVPWLVSTSAGMR
jgi:hypothetical protein